MFLALISVIVLMGCTEKSPIIPDNPGPGEPPPPADTSTITFVAKNNLPDSSYYDQITVNDILFTLDDPQMCFVLESGQTKVFKGADARKIVGMEFIASPDVCLVKNGFQLELTATPGYLIIGTIELHKTYVVEYNWVIL